MIKDRQPIIRRRRKTINTLLLLLFFVLLNLAGCAPVAPWERGNLAKPQMVPDPYPMQSGLRSHSYRGREAAIGGDSAEGGGCGCY
ncbi:DUF4266 domain-containing protein [Nitrosococcus oceani]|uniref:Arginine decarboxylase n=1 Tax=Nitrosococcus oceani C-27 TaxID=314279 RepID=A0A0E2Z3P3_9GAMM|nr:DUF4266 domain-containing protein [Nitrosococcus oceani]KFI19811.1 arginine decarboxylase [Nitrosococcus oceani C-27]GEM19379.1 arginine decarboxylase [Nitrosococcus oceani]